VCRKPVQGVKESRETRLTRRPSERVLWWRTLGQHIICHFSRRDVSFPLHTPRPVSSASKARHGTVALTQTLSRPVDTLRWWDDEQAARTPRGLIPKSSKRHMGHGQDAVNELVGRAGGVIGNLQQRHGLSKSSGALDVLAAGWIMVDDSPSDNPADTTAA
jgi:hypothetical protein